METNLWGWSQLQPASSSPTFPLSQSLLLLVFCSDGQNIGGWSVYHNAIAFPRRVTSDFPSANTPTTPNFICEVAFQSLVQEHNCGVTTQK